MNLMNMSFKNFVWRHNPTMLKVTAAGNVKETALPFADSVVENLGRKKRKVIGEGYFVGDDCREQWYSLSKVFEENTAGALRLPWQAPFYAVMNSLNLVGVAGKNLIKYEFEFTEVEGQAKHDGSGTYTALAGETLWHYAMRFGCKIDDLVKANPEIDDTMHLAEGQEVRVP